MLSPGAHIDLLEEAPTHAWHTNTIHGFPFRVDPELADPANDAKSVVAGDFRSAYVVRLLPVRIETANRSPLGDSASTCGEPTAEGLGTVVTRADK